MVLRGDYIGENLTAVAQDRHGCIVAGGFNTEDQHGNLFSARPSGRVALWAGYRFDRRAVAGIDAQRSAEARLGALRHA